MHRRRLQLTPPLLDILWLTLLSWLGLIVAVLGVAVGISIFGDVTRSVLEPFAQLVGWFALFMGSYLNHDVLALHVTHGQTRRSFAQMAGIFVLALAGFSGFLMAVGYVIERALYRIGGWPHRIDRDHLFSSPMQVPLVFIEYTLTALVWSLAGALMGAAVYRWGNDGWLMLPLAVVLIGMSGVAFGGGWGPIELIVRRVGDGWSDPPVHPVLAIPICLVAVGAAAAVIWPMIRDMPIRQPKS